MWRIAGANQPIHWFLGGKGLGIQQGTSVWFGLPNLWRMGVLPCTVQLPSHWGVVNEGMWSWVDRIQAIHLQNPILHCIQPFSQPEQKFDGWSFRWWIIRVCIIKQLVIFNCIIYIVHQTSVGIVLISPLITSWEGEDKSLGSSPSYAQDSQFDGLLSQKFSS